MTARWAARACAAALLGSAGLLCAPHGLAQSAPAPVAPVPAAPTPLEPTAAEPVQPAHDHAGRFRLGLRTGYGLPLGRYAGVRTFATFRDDDVNALSDDTYGVIPLWLDAGYWLTSHVYLGAYFAFGLVLPKSAPADNPLSGGCPEGVDCAASGVRTGITAEYAFGPYGSTRPWLGLGLGYEWVSSTIEDSDLSLKLESSHDGFEFFQLSGGADFSLTPDFAVGPFATLSALQYTSCTLDFRGEQACEINEASWHGWLLLGVRGSLAL